MGTRSWVAEYISEISGWIYEPGGFQTAEVP
jgi:hypothetical protein